MPLYLVHTDQPDLKTDLILEAVYPDSNLVIPELQDVITGFYRDGFLAASIDSMVYGPEGIMAYLHRGPVFEWAFLSLDSIDRSVLRKARINRNRFRETTVFPDDLVMVQKRIITACEDIGYPFASVRIRGLSFDDRLFSGEMVLDKGPLILIDSMIIKGSAKISSHYIEKQTGIGKGDVYNETRLAEMTNRIDETTFLREIKPHEVEFSSGKADVYAYLEKSRANRFNGIVGILPNHEKTGKLLVTGDLDLLLLNSFGKGESMHIQWKKLEPFTMRS